MHSEYLADSIFEIDAITEFCKNSLQQLPVNKQFLSTAVQQIEAYLHTFSLVGMSYSYTHSLTSALNSLKFSLKVTTDLVNEYELLRIIILLLLIRYYVIVVADKSPLFPKFQTCMSYIDKGDLFLGVNLGEVIIPQIGA